jgi:hypothetical protein
MAGAPPRKLGDDRCPAIAALSSHASALWAERCADELDAEVRVPKLPWRIHAWIGDARAVPSCRRRRIEPISFGFL